MTLKRLVLVALLVTALATTPVAWAAGPFYTGVDVAASQEEAPGFFATLASLWQTVWDAIGGGSPTISSATDDPTADPTPDGGGTTTTDGDAGPGLDPFDSTSPKP
jgi:hypothetical protein